MTHTDPFYRGLKEIAMRGLHKDDPIVDTRKFCWKTPENIQSNNTQKDCKTSSFISVNEKATKN